MNPRAKNEGWKKVGYTNTYDCDNRKVKDINCKKKIRVIHWYRLINMGEHYWTDESLSNCNQRLLSWRENVT